MQAEYTERPERVTVQTHSIGTDVTMRRDIREQVDTEACQTLWTCEELQWRFRQPVDAAAIEAAFDAWWEALRDLNAGTDAAALRLRIAVGGHETALDDVYSALAELAELIVGGA